MKNFTPWGGRKPSLGHALAGDNLAPEHLARGRRGCKTCKRDSLRRWRGQQKERAHV